MQTATWLWAVAAVAAAVGMGVVVRTRWLQSRTLEKCIALSILLHAVLAVVCVFVGGLAPASRGTLDEGAMTMLLVAEAPAPAAPVPLVPSGAGADHADPPADVVPLLRAEPEAGPDAAPADAAPATAAVVPTLYADRVGERRTAAAAARGGSEETERAVQAALAWLAVSQENDGRWDAARHGGGRGRAGGQHEASVGARSDHGVTGLALLAFLGAGTTHRAGHGAGVVDRGIRFLVDRQRADGSLAGDAEFFAALYCHGMATLALAECTALTGDAALRPPLERAVRYTLAMQHPVTGGWRYAAGDRGDTSQLGWQVMALASARQAGVGGIPPAEELARGFLQGVSSGTAGGLAAYRPRERPNQAMTAEGLICRLFLGLPPDHPAVGEAVEFIGRTPPGRSSWNIYTWYYATLASFHAGGPQWDRWNAALLSALLPLQRREAGPLDGSWDPDPAWGGYGGRVYATALSALTLEVYYRHQPMFSQRTRLAEFPR